MRFAIEGQISNVGAADIFLFLSQTQRTSVVAFERPDQETRVFFMEGQPVWCVSTKVQLQLQARLAVSGVVKLRDIEAALARQKASSDRIPQTLIAEHIATEASMEKDLKALSVDALRDLATWTSGTFTVFDGVTSPPWAHPVTLDFPTLLIEALRGQCQIETLQKEFISRRGVLRARSASRSSAGLNEAELAILALVDGERTIEDLLKRSGLDEQQALGAMHVLCALHLTDLLPAQRTAKPAPEKAGARSASAPAPSGGPADGRASQRGTRSNELATRSDGKKPPPAPAEVTPPIGEPVVRTGESTAKLNVLPEMALPKGPVRTLRIVSDEKSEVVPLTASSFAIGRHPRNDLVLKDPRISSFHCRVELEGDKYVILDLKSRNGTLLNSARIDRAVLKNHDQIQLGSTKVHFIETH